MWLYKKIVMLKLQKTTNCKESRYTSEEDLEPDLVRDMKTLSSLMITRCTSLMELRSFFLDTSYKKDIKMKMKCIKQ